MLVKSCRLLSLCAVFLCVLTNVKCGKIPIRDLFFNTESTTTCGYQEVLEILTKTFFLWDYPAHTSLTAYDVPQSCPKPVEGKINIHLVPHTHDDVGWLKTVDQYYWGSRSLVQKAGVQYILDSVIQELLEDPDRRFIYVETAFLWKWLLHQDDARRLDVRRLINEGRLEIIGGAWSMNDEATTHYQSIIDQFTWGLRRLNDTFGKCARPRIGWQIDPFGHSREQAAIFAQMGYDGFFFGRLDYQDKRKRLSEKTPEFVWRGSDSLGEKADIFTGALFNTYSPPPGLCFDVLCADEPLIDDIESPDYNIPLKIKAFVKYVDGQALHFRTNNVILTMGGDFTYQDAQMWYKNLDKLIRYTNERNGTNYNAFYSTPSCYLKAIHEANLTWSTKDDDFFPYASDPHAFWTGYYTSRPTVKFFERMGNNVLQISKQLAVLGEVSSEAVFLESFREAMGVMQHHDAVTGTEKQDVAEDYARILFNGIKDGETVVTNALRTLMSKDDRAGSRADLELNVCYQLNVSSCSYTEKNKNFVATVYNSLSWETNLFVRLPVTGKSYVVKDSTGARVVTQIVPIPASVLVIPGRESSAVNELVFEAPNVPALGYQSYYVSENTDPTANDVCEAQLSNSIENKYFNITFDNFGNIRARRVDDAEDTVFVASFHYYEGAAGDNTEFANRSSGAYIFRPRNTVPTNLTDIESNVIYNGPVVDEYQFKINDWLSYVARHYKDAENIEFEWLVGPIPVDDGIGKEIVIRYSSNLQTRKIFYTDSNGRQMLRRERDYRPTWDLTLEEPVAGNYYPVNSKLTLKDENANSRLSILVDRAEGGTSLHDGQAEIMLHRRLLHDDAFGVTEALNEFAFGKGLVVRGQHYVVPSTSTEDDSGILLEKKLTMNLLHRPLTLITPANDVTFDQWTLKYKMQGTGLAKTLPPNIHILTLEPWKDDSLLLRLEHIFEIGEDTRYSQPVEINIQDLFTSFTIDECTETKLAGDRWIDEEERFKWQTQSNEVSRADDTVTNIKSNDGTGINVLLRPMEIRTFIVRKKH